jgi:hypothetical protein
MTTRCDALNDALGRFDGYGYLDAPGFAFHGPMGAETLSTLGHDDLVAGWADEYKTRHQPLDVPPRSEPIDPHDENSWRPALGSVARVSDWEAMFREELWDQPWQVVLQRWVPLLLPGYGGALAHGLIRVAHGVRAISAQCSPPQLLLGEVAKGLALWAASFTTLPGRPEQRGPLTLSEAIPQLPRPREQWAMMDAGSFARIGELPGFPHAVESLGPPQSIDNALSDLTASFCRVVLAHREAFPVPLVHTVTPTAAMRILLPHLPELSIGVLYQQVWQVNAAILSGFTSGPPAGETTPANETEAAPTEILARAVEHKDTHVLKFAEACARENALRPDPVYMAAAQYVLEQLPPW